MDEMHDADEAADPLGGLTGRDRVEAVLEEEDVSPEEALAELVRLLAARHVDIELRKRGRRPAFTPGNERLNALTAAFDAVHEARARNEQAAEAHAQGKKPNATDVRPGTRPDDPALVDPALARDLANLQRVLTRLLMDAQIEAERNAGLDHDVDNPPPFMRLVKE